MKVLAAELLAVGGEARGLSRSTPLPEIALLGRSNVGKSSLLNRLVQRRQLARTSASPGKTRLVHFYRIERPGRALLLVDLPGYGWARVSKAERAGWKALVESYLRGREHLRGAILLQDLRRDWSEDEALLVRLARRAPGAGAARAHEGRQARGRGARPPRARARGAAPACPPSAASSRRRRRARASRRSGARSTRSC